ncbi:MAG: hypothetical protein ACJ8LG_14795 [Massilia sp.]
MAAFFCRGSYRAFLAVTSWSLAMACHAIDATEEYPTLRIQGEEYSNACAAVPKNHLRDTLLAGKVQDAAQAWRAVDAMLCVPDNDTNRSYVKSFVPKKVHEAAESTGDKPTFRMVARSEELVRGLMAAGKAWDASIRAEPDKVILQYFANEACVKVRTLTYEKFKWSVYEVGEACD